MGRVVRAFRFAPHVHSRRRLPRPSYKTDVVLLDRRVGLAVPGDRLIPSQYGRFVLIPGTAGNWRVNGLSTAVRITPVRRPLQVPMGKHRSWRRMNISRSETK